MIYAISNDSINLRKSINEINKIIGLEMFQK